MIIKVVKDFQMKKLTWHELIMHAQKSYEIAVKNAEWRQTIDVEIVSIEKNKTRHGN